MPTEFYIIPKEQAYRFRKVLVTHWFGIDAIEVKDGTYIIGRDCYDEIKKWWPEAKITINEESLSLTKELDKYPIKVLTAKDFKVEAIER